MTDFGMRRRPRRFDARWCRAVSMADRVILQQAKELLAEGESMKFSHWLADRES
jgi:hypothetical protein